MTEVDSRREIQPSKQKIKTTEEIACDFCLSPFVSYPKGHRHYIRAAWAGLLPKPIQLKVVDTKTLKPLARRNWRDLASEPKDDKFGHLSERI